MSMSFLIKSVNTADIVKLLYFENSILIYFKFAVFLTKIFYLSNTADKCGIIDIHSYFNEFLSVFKL